MRFLDGWRLPLDSLWRLDSRTFSLILWRDFYLGVLRCEHIEPWPNSSLPLQFRSPLDILFVLLIIARMVAGKRHTLEFLYRFLYRLGRAFDRAVKSYDHPADSFHRSAEPFRRKVGPSPSLTLSVAS